MKLEFAKNLRELRLRRDLTQDELAEQLGVSVQTISRWENSSKASYPDIELLPTIAGFFGVTVDELLGCSKAQSDERLAKYWEELDRLLYQNHPENEILSHLKKMHNEYPNNMDVMCRLSGFITNCSDLREDPYYIEMVRIFASYVMEHSTEKHQRESIAHAIVMVESEDHLEETLNKYASLWNISASHLLEHRYLKRKDGRDSYIKAYQENRAYFIDRILTASYSARNHFFPDEAPFPELQKFIVKMELDLIDAFCEYESINSVIGDGIPDLWSENRIRNGILYAKILATEGEVESALSILEDAATLAEAVASLEEGAVLTYRSPLLDRLSATVERDTSMEGNLMIFAIANTIEGAGLSFITDTIFELLTKDDRSGYSFDSLKEDGRFEVILERFEKIKEIN